MKKIITDIKELMTFSQVINNNFEHLELSNMTVLFEVDKRTLKSINEDFYYSNNTMGKPEDTDEIVATVNGITFKYTLKEEE
jgi:hypothetical protein